MKHGVYANWFTVRERTDRDLKWWRQTCALLARLGISDVVLGISSNPKTPQVWSPLWRESEVLAAASEAMQKGMGAHMLFWARREKDYLAPALDTMLKWQAGIGGDCLVIPDCEGSWHRSDGDWDDDGSREGNLEGAEQAAEYMAERLSGRPWAATGLGPLQPSVAALAKLAPIVIPQALSIYHPTDEGHWSRSARNVRELTPPRIQERSARMWREAGAEHVELELANYWLARPGMNADAVFRGQVEAAEQLGAEVVRCQAGFKLCDQITREDLDLVKQAIDAFHSQARKMETYAHGLRRRLHAMIG
jgi:hypothetical protein